MAAEASGSDSSVRLTVQAGPSDDLWIWLLDAGWRVVTHRPDRRRYRDIPGPGSHA
jgi:hypothetical protein